MKTVTKTMAWVGAASLAVMSAVVIAHSAHFDKSARSAENSNEFRNAAMTAYKWYLSPMGAMAKGKMEFDEKVFASNAAGLAMSAKMDILEAYPKGSSKDDIEDSRSKASIWENTEDFAKMFADFQSEADKLAEVAKAGGSKEDIMKQFKKAADTCSTCHKAYRGKQG